MEAPRDCDRSFTSLLIPKSERRFAGFDEKIVAMYDRGRDPVCPARCNA
ncbi:hypothetical protein [Alcaligenes faecalis]